MSPVPFAEDGMRGRTFPFRTAYAGLRGAGPAPIGDTDHFIFVDQPAKFGAALREFLPEQA